MYYLYVLYIHINIKYNMANDSTEVFKTFFDSTQYIIYIMVLGLVLVLITFGTKINEKKILSLIMKIGIVGLYLYMFTIVYKSLGSIFNMNGLFLSPSLSKVKIFFILYCLFELCIVILVLYILYTIFR
jgi:hypothetical protein